MSRRDSSISAGVFEASRSTMSATSQNWRNELGRRSVGNSLKRSSRAISWLRPTMYASMKSRLVSSSEIVSSGMRCRLGISRSAERSRSGAYIGSANTGCAITGTIVWVGRCGSDSGRCTIVANRAGTVRTGSSPRSTAARTPPAPSSPRRRCGELELEALVQLAGGNAEPCSLGAVAPCAPRLTRRRCGVVVGGHREARPSRHCVDRCARERALLRCLGGVQPHRRAPEHDRGDGGGDREERHDHAQRDGDEGEHGGEHDERGDDPPAVRQQPGEPVGDPVRPQLAGEVVDVELTGRRLLRRCSGDRAVVEHR